MPRGLCGAKDGNHARPLNNRFKWLFTTKACRHSANFPDGNVRKIFIFRDHGGGSLYGVCVDMYTQNIISLQEIKSAFETVWGTSPEDTLNNPPDDKRNADATTVPKVNRYNLSDLTTIEPEVNYDSKIASIHLDEQQLSRISGIRCQAARFHYYEDEHFNEQVELLFLGGDTVISENWHTGDFESTFRDKWLKI